MAAANANICVGYTSLSATQSPEMYREANRGVENRLYQKLLDLGQTSGYWNNGRVPVCPPATTAITKCHSNSLIRIASCPLAP